MPTFDSADRQKEMNQKKLEMLRNVYQEKHDRLMKQTQMLSSVKKQVRLGKEE